MILLAWLSSQLTVPLIASYFISRSLPLLLSLVGLLLCVVGLGFFWLSGRFASTMNGKLISRSELRGSKARWALQQLQTVGPLMATAIVFFSLGAMWQANRQLNKALQGFDNTVQILNAVVEHQNGLTLEWHYLDDPEEKQHTQIFCAQPANRVPHLKARQIIANMDLIRRDDCEVVAELNLRRVNGVAILAGGY